MIVLCQKLMPRILRIYTTPDWSSIGDFELLDHILDQCILTNSKIIVLFSNPNPDEKEYPFPPISYIITIAAKLLMLRSKISEAVDYNIIHLQDDEARSNVNNFLQYYTPVNPTHVVETKEEIVAILNGD